MTTAIGCSSGDAIDAVEPGIDESEVVASSIVTTKVVRTVADVPSAPPAGAFRVHLIDVGAGLSVLVQGHDFSLLFDGGSMDDRGGISRTGNRNRLLAYLYAAIGPSGSKECVPDGDAWPQEVDAPKRTLNHVFLSHPHQDHVSMLDDVLRCYQAEHVWDSGSPYPTAIYREFVHAVADDPSIQYHSATAVPTNKTVTVNGENIEIRGGWTQFSDSRRPRSLGTRASFKILHADGSFNEDANQNSTVVSVKLGDRRLLLLGDAESGPRDDPSAPTGRIEQFLLQTYPFHIRADIMQVGHHGSKSSSRLEFLKAVRPSIALLSAGPQKYNEVRLPDIEVVRAIEGLKPDLKLLRTDANDEACPVADRIGVDTGTGGCDNYIIDITPK